LNLRRMRSYDGTAFQVKDDFHSYMVIVMKEFKNKVAVITGGASGIGRGLAERAAHKGMKVVLADIDEQGLEKTEAELKGRGAQVLAVKTDVSRLTDIEALATKTLQAFGGVHLLVNNAGVSAGTTIRDSTIKDWEWVIGVDLWSVIYGLKVFVPIMLDQDTEGHVVNTASLAGLISGPGQAAYKVAKHGVVTLSETLYHELTLNGAKVGVSVLCPGFVKTAIMDCDKHRPQDLCNLPEEEVVTPEYEMWRQYYKQMIEGGMSCEMIADMVFSAISENKFYILTHADFRQLIELRMHDILEERNPTDILQTLAPPS